MPRSVLRPEFFLRSAEEIARDLLGLTLVSDLGGVRTSGRISETEAYLGFDDPASHAYHGRRHTSNASIYGSAGSWYVYRSYGLHWCANLVCGPPGSGSAVLLRGLTPEEGIAIMRVRRGRVPDRILANGPGKLTQALAITRQIDGQAMGGCGVVVLRARRVTDSSVRRTPRIGITKAVDWPLRFVVVA